MAQASLTPGGCDLCGGPRDTIKRVDGVVKVVCFGCAGRIAGGPPKDASEMDRALSEAERLQAREAEEAARMVAEPPEPKPRVGREKNCVDCGTALEGRQRKRCAPCAKVHHEEYMRNYFRGRRRA